MNIDLVCQWLERLVEISRPRPMLVQHFDRREEKDKEYDPVRHDWHLWPCPHNDLPIFHHSTPWNAVLFECDDPPANTVEGWATQAEQLRKFVKFLDENNIPSELSYGGNKSFHLWVYIDMARVLAQFKDDLGNLKLDIPRLVRLTIFEELPDVAKVFLVFDESNVNFYLNKKGRMVRAYGSKRPGALSKTWMPSIPRIRPKEDHWNIPPSTPQLWFPERYMQQIRDAVEREKAAIAARAEAGGLVDVGGDWRKLLGNVPWLKADARWGAGEREPHATMCVRAMLTAGLSEDEARKELETLTAHVKETDYDFETHWYDKVGRLFREARYLEYIPETLDIELQMAEAAKEVGLQIMSDDARVSENRRSSGGSPGSTPQAGSTPAAQPIVAPSVFANGLAIDIDIDEIPRRIEAPPPTPESRSFMQELILTAKNKASIIRNLSDAGNAERLVYRFGENIKFVFMGQRKGKWAVWDGNRWRFDDGAHVGLLTIANARLIPSEVEAFDDPKFRKRVLDWALTSESEGKLNSAASIARNYNNVKLSEFDANPLLFNVENGTIDLRTGEFRSHQRDDYLMMMAGVKYDKDATCPKFMAFLEKVFPDAEIREHLQRFIGYSLTGNMGERVFRVDWGQLARNGKSTLYRTLRKLFGDYAMTVTFETFSADRAGSIRNDLAALAGRRLILAIESATKFELDVNLIKSITGGDEQQARFLFLEYFNFYPQCKLIMASNNKATIVEGNNAIWDRMHLIEWKVRITDKEEIKDFAEKELFPELPGILNWAIEGCRKWQESGLTMPQEIKNAVQVYRDEQYIIRDFIEDICVEGDDFETPFGPLFERYKTWALMQDIRKPLGKRGFANALRDRFKYRTLDGRPIYLGLRLRPMTG